MSTVRERVEAALCEQERLSALLLDHEARTQRRFVVSGVRAALDQAPTDDEFRCEICGWTPNERAEAGS